MQKVTAFSKTKFCSSRGIVIISVLYFISKQLKLKLVSFLYLLHGRGLPAPEATTLFVVSGYGGVWTGRAARSPQQECPFWTGLWNSHLVGGSESDYMRWSNFFWVSGCWLGRLLKQLREKVATTQLTNCRPDLGYGFWIQLCHWFIAWPWTGSGFSHLCVVVYQTEKLVFWG